MSGSPRKAQGSTRKEEGDTEEGTRISDARFVLAHSID
jgi:hypothetical protein